MQIQVRSAEQGRTVQFLRTPLLPVIGAGPTDDCRLYHVVVETLLMNKSFMQF